MYLRAYFPLSLFYFPGRVCVWGGSIFPPSDSCGLFPGQDRPGDYFPPFPLSLSPFAILGGKFPPLLPFFWFSPFSFLGFPPFSRSLVPLLFLIHPFFFLFFLSLFSFLFSLHAIFRYPAESPRDSQSAPESRVRVFFPFFRGEGGFE